MNPQGNREPALASVVIERQHDIEVQAGHVWRLANSTSLINVSKAATSSDYSHIKYNPKLRMMEDDRRATIDHENLILLNKMRKIFERGTVASNSGGVKTFEAEPRSLNSEARRRELERITRDNLGIVQRIRSRRPNYSAAHLDHERHKTEALLRRISKTGQRRSDYFSQSVAGYSAISGGGSSVGGGGGLSRSSSAVGPSPMQATPHRPRRLRALDDNILSGGLAASLTQVRHRAIHISPYLPIELPNISRCIPTANRISPHLPFTPHR